MRIAVAVPFAVVFVLGLAMVGFGLALAVYEAPWDLRGRTTEAVVVERYEKEVWTRESERISADRSFEPRLAYEFVDAEGRTRRGDAAHTYRHAWAQLKPGDRIEIEHLPDGDSRLTNVNSVATMWLALAGWGLLPLVVGGGVTFLLMRFEMGAGRSTDETIGGAMTSTSA